MMTPQEIVERIMTAHWDMKCCECWLCIEGRKLGMSPRVKYGIVGGDGNKGYPVPQFPQTERTNR